MTLLLIRCIKHLITRGTLGEIGQINVVLFLAVDVALHVLHQAHIVVQNLVAVPTLKIKSTVISVMDMLYENETPCKQVFLLLHMVLI